MILARGPLNQYVIGLAKALWTRGFEIDGPVAQFDDSGYVVFSIAGRASEQSGEVTIKLELRNKRREDGPARGARRLAVVAGSIVLPDAVRPAVVRGRRARDPCMEGERVGGRGRGGGLREEATVLDLDRVRGGPRERVGHSSSARRSSGTTWRG